MSIKRKTQNGLVVIFALGLVVLTSFLYVQDRTKRIIDQYQKTNDVLLGVNEFSAILSAYIADPYGDANLLWSENLESLLKNLESIDSTDESTIILIDGVRELIFDVQFSFSDLVLINRYGEDYVNEFNVAEQEVILSQVELATARLIEEISDLKSRYTLLLNQYTRTQDFVFLFLILLLLGSSSFFGVYQSKRVVNRISLLSDSVLRVKKGTYNLSMPKEDVRDEITLLQNYISKLLHEIELYETKLEQKVSQRSRALRNANAENATILQSLGDGLILTDANGVIKLLNDSAQDILGYEESEVVGQKWFDVVNPINHEGDLYKESNSPLMKLKKLKTDYYHLGLQESIFYHNKKGDVFPVSLTASKVRQGKKLVGLVLVFRDITEELKIDAYKSEFASLASHQLRTPLTGIRWNVELLKEGAHKFSKEEQMYINDLHASVTRMIQLVEDILMLSEIELGASSSKFPTKKLVDVVDQILKEQEAHISKMNAKVDVKYGKQTRSEKVIQDLVSMVVSNLLVNAINYSGEKPVVKIEFSRLSKKRIQATISDNGPGIPEDEIEDVFKKFKRGKSAQLVESDGNGLGLYIVKMIVERMGGGIRVKSSSKGTKITFTLPIKK